MKIDIDEKIVAEIRKAYPEIHRASATDVVDWALRLLIKQAQVDKVLEKASKTETS